MGIREWPPILSVSRVSFEDKWGSVTRVCARKREKGRWRRVGEEIGGEDGRDGEKRHPDFVEDALVKAKCNEIEKAERRRVLVSLFVVALPLFSAPRWTMACRRSRRGRDSISPSRSTRGHPLLEPLRGRGPHLPTPASSNR